MKYAMLILVAALLGCCDAPVQHLGRGFVRDVHYGDYGQTGVVFETASGATSALRSCHADVPLWKGEEVADVLVQYFRFDHCYRFVSVQR